jgi:hypothetical protein
MCDKAYTVKLLEQDIVKTPEGVFYSLSEPLKWCGTKEKLVTIAEGRFTDERMSIVRKDIMARFGHESISFTLERIPILDFSCVPPRAMSNQMDSKVSHSFNIRGRLSAVLGYLANALMSTHNSFVVTTDP